MPNYHTKLEELLKDLKRAKKRAVNDQRRIFYLGLGNPVFSFATVAWGYLSSIPNVSTVALVMAVVKDTSIWSAISKRVVAYWRGEWGGWYGPPTVKNHFGGGGAPGGGGERKATGALPRS